MIPHVTAADVNDRTALEEMVIGLQNKYPAVAKLWADMGYQGHDLNKRIASRGIDLEIVRRPRTRFWIPAEVKDVTAYLEARGEASKSLKDLRF